MPANVSSRSHVISTLHVNLARTLSAKFLGMNRLQLEEMRQNILNTNQGECEETHADSLGGSFDGGRATP